MILRKAPDENHGDSTMQTISVPARPEAPAGVSGGTGSISGADETMEYRLSSSDEWVSVKDTEPAGLEPGTYLIRVKATETSFAGETVSVTVRSTSGGSSGGGGVGGGAAAPSYSIETEADENGTVKTDADKAEKGDTVTVTVEPEEGYELSSLTVLDKNGSPLDVQRKSDTEYTFVMPGGKVTVVPVFAEIKQPEEPETPAEEPDGPGETEWKFEDVADGSWYADAVQYVCENGLMNGTGDGTFSPDAVTTRGMIVTILWRLERAPVIDYLMNFEDVDASSWYAEAVRWAAGEGIVEGIGDGLFAPDDPMTREKMATILHRYTQWKGYASSSAADLSGYDDMSQISGYASAGYCFRRGKVL